MAGKIKVENLTNRGGRPKGSVNKTTATAKAMIENVADMLGGAERMVAWAGEAPENERVFWSSIFTKLIPVQVNGPGEDGEHTIIHSAADILNANLDAIASRTSSQPE